MAEIVIKLVNGELAGKTAQGINKEFSAAALAVKKAEIGTKEWLDATQRLDKAKQMQADYTTQVNATSKASGILKQQFGGILNQIPGFSQLSGALGAAKGGVGGLTSGMGLLKGAIAATGIGLLVIAVAALVSWFSKTEKGANMLSGVFNGLGAVLDTLMNRLWNIRTTLRDLFSDPIKFFKNLGKDIKDAAREGYDLVQVFDDIEDRQRDMKVTAKENDILVDKLILNSRNVGKTFQDRLEILKQVETITKKGYADQLKLSKEYLDAVQREVDAATKQGPMGDKLADKLTDAKLAYLEIVGNETQVLGKVENAREKIFDKQEKALEKEANDKEKNLAKEEKDTTASLKKLEDLRIQSIQDSSEREIAAINLKFDREKEALVLQGAEKIEADKLIEEQRAREIQAVKDKAAEEAAQIALKNLEAEIEADTAAYEKKQALLEAQIKRENQARQQIPAAVAAMATEIANIYIQNSNTAIQQAERRLDNIKRLYGEESTAFQQANAKLNDIRKREFEKQRKIQKAQVVTNGIVEVSNIWKGYAEMGPWAVALAAVQTAIVAARVGAALKQIDSPKFARGGYVEGPSHAQGGVKGMVRGGRPIEFEGGEFFFSKQAVAGIGVDRLAAMNNMFAAGGPVDPFESGRSAAASAGVSGGSMATPGPSIASLAAKLEMWNQAINGRIDRIRVINVASDTQKVNDILAENKADADV